MSYLTDRNLTKFLGWPGGLDNVSSETSLRPDRLRVAQNVDLDDAGKPSRRHGYTKRASGAGCHSLWSGALGLYGVIDGALVAIDEQFQTEELLAGVGLAPLSYADAAGVVYWSSSVRNGVLLPDGTALPFGVDAPSPPQVTTTTDGGLAAGTYLVAVTCVDSRGIESGAGVSAASDVAVGGALQISVEQMPDDAQTVRLYVSQPNGDTCYFAAEYPATLRQYRIGLGVRGKALETQFLFAMPPAQFLTVYNGRMWGAAGSTLWFSEPYRYGHVAPHNFLRFPARIDMVIAVGTATQSVLFVAAGDVTYRLTGADPKKMERLVAHKRGAVPYSAMIAPGNIFNIDGVNEDVAFWTTSHGVQCLGTGAGQVIPLTEKRALTSADAVSGSAMLVERDGVQQMLTTLRGGNASVLFASDSAVAEVIKLSQP